MMITGVERVRGSPLICASTSRPSTFGMFRSSSMTHGLPGGRCAYTPLRNTKCSAASPSCTHTTCSPTPPISSARIVSSASVALSSASRM